MCYNEKVKRLSFLKSYVVFAVVLTMAFTVDILSKYLLTGTNTTVIPGVLSFVFYRNYGIAFGWMADGGVWLAITSAVLIALAIGYYVWHRRELGKQNRKPHLLFDIGFSLFIGGGLGNLFDRVFFGYVRDFIHLDFIRFPIFNFADMFINIGIVLILVYVLFIQTRKKRGTNAEDNG